MEKGKVLSKGIGYGYAYNFDYDSEVNTAKEVTLQEILDIVRQELEDAFGDTENISEEEAMIFDAHMTLLKDCTFINGIEENVKEGMPLSRAIMENGKKNAFVFLNMEDKSLSHIAEDIMDITYQMLDVLKESTSQLKVKEPVIICGDNIYPSTLLNFISNYKVAGIVTRETSELSHSAIIARNAQIPMITRININVKNKMPVIVNGDDNEVHFNPNYEKMMEIKRAPVKEKVRLELPIEIKANAGDLEDVLKISKGSEASIGLFRSEYYYLKSQAMPTDEEIADFVDELFFSFNDRVMDYRLPDFGRDKIPTYLDNNDNLNGISFLFKNDKILLQQINAFKNAKNLNNKRILLSYVTDCAQVSAIKDMLKPLDVEIGVMIESKLDTDMLIEIIRNASFVNIGTNDLICSIANDDRISYIDSKGEHIDTMFDYIKEICRIAHENDLKVCICGEIGADSDYTERIVESGVDSVSVSSIHILNK